MEMQILELRKLPEEVKNEDDIIRWMRFLGGKSRKKFENMAKTDEYIEEAYKELKRMSADERARMEYEARERAIRDYDSQMNSALRHGMEKGIQKGMQKGLQEGILQERKAIVARMINNGIKPEDIAELTGIDLAEVKKLKRKLEEDNK